jgi:hypothetical protein
MHKGVEISEVFREGWGRGSRWIYVRIGLSVL